MFANLRAKHPGTSLGGLLFYEAWSLLVGSVLRIVFRGKAFHTDRVPRDGPLLIAANHQSFLDPPMFGCFTPQRQLDFVARSGLFSWKPLGWVIERLHAIPLREDTGDAAAIREILARLAKDRAVLIFPEGSRTTTGEIDEFKRGVMVLVKRAKCPVIPAAVEGAFYRWPRHGKPTLFGPPVLIAYGHPIPYDELMKDGPDAALQRLDREVRALQAELRAKRNRGTRAADAPAKVS